MERRINSSNGIVNRTLPVPDSGLVVGGSTAIVAVVAVSVVVAGADGDDLVSALKYLYRPTASDCADAVASVLVVVVVVRSTFCITRLVSSFDNRSMDHTSLHPVAVTVFCSAGGNQLSIAPHKMTG